MRTVAKQQQAAERIAAATTELTRNIAESSEAAGQLETPMQEMAAGAEESSSACQQSLSVVEAINQRIAVQKTESRRMQNLVGELRSLVDETKAGIDGLIHTFTTAELRRAQLRNEHMAE